MSICFVAVNALRFGHASLWVCLLWVVCFAMGNALCSRKKLETPSSGWVLCDMRKISTSTKEANAIPKMSTPYEVTPEEAHTDLSL